VFLRTAREIRKIYEPYSIDMNREAYTEIKSMDYGFQGDILDIYLYKKHKMLYNRRVTGYAPKCTLKKEGFL